MRCEHENFRMDDYQFEFNRKKETIIFKTIWTLCAKYNLACSNEIPPELQVKFKFKFKFWIWIWIWLVALVHYLLQCTLDISVTYFQWSPKRHTRFFRHWILFDIVLYLSPVYWLNVYVSRVLCKTAVCPVHWQCSLALNYRYVYIYISN